MSRLKRDILFLGLCLLLACVAVLMVAPRVLAIDEVIDNYQNTTRVNITVDVVHNATWDVMELNFTTSAVPLLENYTAYTEVDPNGRITVDNDTHITYTLWENEEARVYYDYGAGYFTDFIHENDVIADNNDPDSNAEQVIVWGVSKDLDDGFNIDDGIILRLIASGSGPEIWFFRLTLRESDVPTSDDSVNINEDQWYHLRYNRTGDNMDVEIYTDTARTNLLDTMTVTIANSSEVYRYVYAVNTFNRGQLDWVAGRVANLKLGRTDGAQGYAPTGYFTTTNFLAGISYNATVGLFNSSIPGGSINVEWSPDGMAWTDLGLISTNTWAEDLRGFQSPDAILRFNFTRGSPLVTPRLYQVRLVHEGPGGGGPCANVTGLWTLYNFTSIAIIDGTNASVGGNWLNQTYWLDGYEYNVTEVVGAPGYDIPFNVSGLPDGLICLQLVGFMAYDGSGGHTFEVQAYNYTSSAWVIISDIPDSSSQWINGTIACEPDDFIQGGLFQGRYYHPSPGNVNHDFILDYGKLRAFSPSPCPVIPTPTPAVSGVTYLTYALAIILLLFGLMIGSRVRR